MTESFHEWVAGQGLCVECGSESTVMVGLCMKCVGSMVKEDADRMFKRMTDTLMLGEAGR